MNSPLLNLLNTHRHTLDLGVLQLSYLEWQRGTEPVLLLHGLADCAIVWTSLAESLGEGYHIIAPDWRGHGESSKPDRGYRCTDLIGDLEALMAHFGWESAHIVAHSWAAKVVTVWATQKPDRCRSLVLVDPFFIDSLPNWWSITFPLLDRVLPFLKMMDRFATLDRAEQQARQLKQYRGWSDLQAGVFQANIEQKADGSWGSKFVPQARDEIFLDVLQVKGLTSPLDIPTLFLQPAGGLNRTEWQLKPYRTYLTNLQIEQIPGNHWAFLVEPEPFNRAVSEFFSSMRDRVTFN